MLFIGLCLFSLSASSDNAMPLYWVVRHSPVRPVHFCCILRNSLKKEKSGNILKQILAGKTEIAIVLTKLLMG